MATRTLLVTMTIEVRDPTEAELSDGQFQNDDYEMIDPLDWLSDMEATELSEPILMAVLSEGNPEVFAGTGLFVQTTAAAIQSISWIDKTAADFTGLDTALDELRKPVDEVRE